MSDWDHRQLCPDGACVGLIGDDGTCKVCGRAAPNWGDERKRGMVDASDEDDVEDDDDEDADDESEDGDADEEDEDEADDDAQDGVISASAGGEWTDRKLCPDGGCVGVIGDNGTCKVCGRSAA